MPGYETKRFVNFSEIENSDLLCSICHQIFKDPVVANCCRQTFCDECIREWRKTNNTCPYDRKELTDENLLQPPRIISNLLGKLQIRCDNTDCLAIVTLEELAQHTVNCASGPKICTKCEKKIQSLEKENEFLIDKENNSVAIINALTQQLDQLNEAVKLSRENEISLKKDNILINRKCQDLIDQNINLTKLLNQKTSDKSISAPGNKVMFNIIQKRAESVTPLTCAPITPKQQNKSVFGTNASKGTFSFGNTSHNSTQSTGFAFNTPTTKPIANTSSNLTFGLNTNSNEQTIGTNEITNQKTNSKPTTNQLFTFGQTSGQLSNPLTHNPLISTTIPFNSSEFNFGLNSDQTTGQTNSTDLFGKAPLFNFSNGPPVNIGTMTPTGVENNPGVFQFQAVSRGGKHE